MEEGVRQVCESDEHAARAFSTFVANEKIIAAHNARSVGWTMALNQFSDLTAQDFHAQWLGYDMANATSELETIEEHVAPSDEIFPESVDWSVRAGCSHVKTQGGCNSCWAFSATGAIEAQLCGPQLSEQDLVSCDPSGHGCSGSWMGLAFRWVQKNGIASEAAYPYVGKRGVGHCDTAKEKQAVATVDGVVRVTSESKLKSAVSGRAVSVAVSATCLQHYRGGIIDQESCDGSSLNHGVLAVGFGNHGKPYWKIKNSWGPGWGESGYFRVVQGKNMMGVGKQGVYPTGVKRL